MPPRVRLRVSRGPRVRGMHCGFFHAQVDCDAMSPLTRSRYPPPHAPTHPRAVRRPTAPPRGKLVW
eukprot:1726093-Prymnesium_polylepis.1